jgi:23S rRNA (guanosine2251-2'-O)-methyltransferase
MKKLASTGLKISILLHDIRSVHNVGSIFRTADAFGVSKIYISGITPSPTDRFGRIRSDIAKVALGAEISVPWEAIGGKIEEVENFIGKFKKSGGKIVALEQDPRSISYKDVGKEISGVSEALLVLGNEVGGVDSAFLDSADVIFEIPMLGKKESLNVSVAAGIALFVLR